MVYQIRIIGNLDQSWETWLGNVSIQCEPGENDCMISILTGDLPDQAMLFGILDRIRDLNLELLSVNKIERIDEQ